MLDPLSHPLQFIQHLHDTQSSVSIPDHYKDLLNQDSIRNRVRYLNKSALDKGLVQPSTVVRYRGLVQDIFDPEYFTGIYEIQQEGGVGPKRVVAKYCDAPPPILGDEEWSDYDAQGEDPGSVTMTRLPLLLIPLEESTWVRVLQQNSAKDKLINDETAMELIEENQSDTINDVFVSNNKKRNLDIEEEGGDKRAQKMTIEEAAAENNQWVFSKTETEISCLCKMYDYQEEHFRINDMIEVLGVYTFDPFLYGPGDAVENRDTSMEEGDDEIDDELFNSVTNTPASQLSRIHCLIFTRLGSTFPLCKDPTSFLCHQEMLTTAQNMNLPPANYKYCVEQMIRIISDSLGGNRSANIAAESIALALISKTYTTYDSSALGGLYLNITGLSPGDNRVHLLANTLSKIVPRLKTVIFLL